MTHALPTQHPACSRPLAATLATRERFCVLSEPTLLLTRVGAKPTNRNSVD